MAQGLIFRQEQLPLPHVSVGRDQKSFLCSVRLCSGFLKGVSVLGGNDSDPSVEFGGQAAADLWAPNPRPGAVSRVPCGEGPAQPFALPQATVGVPEAQPSQTRRALARQEPHPLRLQRRKKYISLRETFFLIPIIFSCFDHEHQ